ncbi:MAG: dehydratase [Bradyrhizobiaceae bacterium PARB1]|jgi:acyl dehydratase|nr:MAG: dehydratase [Bradyrhizobiaceae bacterium PARB1]
MPFLEDMKVGLRRELGTFTFTAEAIKIFAREFDPQPFHLDEEAGRNSLFGGLVASGWHVASVCMKLIVADGVRARQEVEARGEEFGTGGPSPGFRDLRWLKPVFAGDTLTYSGEIVSVRATASRPGWGIVQSKNVAVNQRGEEVYSFIGSVFLPQRSDRN